MEGGGRKVAEEGGEWKKNGAREGEGKRIVEGREREWEGGREREWEGGKGERVGGGKGERVGEREGMYIRLTGSW